MVNLLFDVSTHDSGMTFIKVYKIMTSFTKLTVKGYKEQLDDRLLNYMDTFDIDSLLK